MTKISKQINITTQKNIFKALAAKSKLTEKDAKELTDKINKGMLKELKKKFNL